MASSKRGRGVRGRARARRQPAYAVADVVARLCAHRQRATYAAVGALRGAPAVRVRGWFSGREAPENSFVVSRMSGEPIGYPPDLVHPALKERGAVIETADALRDWLATHPPARSPPRDGQPSRRATAPAGPSGRATARRVRARSPARAAPPALRGRGRR